MNKNWLIWLFVGVISCDRGAEIVFIDFPPGVKVSNLLYDYISSDPFTIREAFIKSDSLLVSISYCDGCGMIVLDLIAAVDKIDFEPVERNITLSLEDRDL